MIINRYEKIAWDEVSNVKDLGDTKRGSGGFGHIGK